MLNADQLLRLSPEDQAELLALLEAERMFNIRLNLNDFAVAMPIPGTPAPHVASETALWVAKKGKKDWEAVMLAARERVRRAAFGLRSSQMCLIAVIPAIAALSIQRRSCRYRQLKADKIPPDRRSEKPRLGSERQ